MGVWGIEDCTTKFLWGPDPWTPRDWRLWCWAWSCRFGSSAVSSIISWLTCSDIGFPWKLSHRTLQLLQLKQRPTWNIFKTDSEPAVLEAKTKSLTLYGQCVAFSALTLLVGVRKGIRPAKNWVTRCVGIVICLEQGANDMHMVQLIPLPPHCFLLH